ncbi:MAG: hypothetical protein H6R19_2529 [Proteobacteria bacterium]|nr:hypothetical protein [Pseudomonadota bacterium]
MLVAWRLYVGATPGFQQVIEYVVDEHSAVKRTGPVIPSRWIRSSPLPQEK